MPGTIRWIALTVLCVSPTAVAFGQISARGEARMKLLRQPVAQETATQPAMPSAPLPQVPMKDLPATPPQVSYQNGMLTIVAENSTLGDILREVHRRSGATIDVPANATERVVTRLGPGPARDVLASLLNGSAFNYVMVGTATDPLSLAKVILTTKPAGGVTEAAYQPPPQQYIPQQVVTAPGMGPGGPVTQQAQSDDDGDTAEDAEDNADQDQDQDQTNGAAANGDASQLPNAGPKTPQQILEMLRQRQQAPQGWPPVNPTFQQPPPQQPDNNE
jgi:hypothetical protein